MGGKWKEETQFRIRQVDAADREIEENYRERRNNANIVGDENRKASTESRDKVSRWVKYIESQYKGDVVADFIENENEVQNGDGGGGGRRF